eukprot:259826_1
MTLMLSEKVLLVWCPFIGTVLSLIASIITCIWSTILYFTGSLSAHTSNMIHHVILMALFSILIHMWMLFSWGAYLFQYNHNDACFAIGLLAQFAFIPTLCLYISLLYSYLCIVSPNFCIVRLCRKKKTQTQQIQKCKSNISGTSDVCRVFIAILIGILGCTIPIVFELIMGGDIISTYGHVDNIFGVMECWISVEKRYWWGLLYVLVFIAMVISIPVIYFTHDLYKKLNNRSNEIKQKPLWMIVYTMIFYVIWGIPFVDRMLTSEPIYFLEIYHHNSISLYGCANMVAWLILNKNNSNNISYVISGSSSSQSQSNNTTTYNMLPDSICTLYSQVYNHSHLSSRRHNEMIAIDC